MAKIYLTDSHKSFLKSSAAGVPERLDAFEKLSKTETRPAASVSTEMQSIIAGWEGLGVIADYHRETDAWIFIALHNLKLGLPVGGCRIKPYSRPLDGMRDALLLAEGMTNKWAVLGSGFGGGKAVLTLPHQLEPAARAHLLLHFGNLLEKFGGLFCTGSDFGMTAADLAVIAKASRYVHGFDAATGRLIDSGIYTALGVKAGISAALRHSTGDGNFSARRILIQGVGQVGGQLARMLVRDGANVLISDTDKEKVRRLAEELGCETIAPEQVPTTACEVYAPCALGGTLNRQSVSRLKCHLVAGAANNQLEGDCVADQLHERAILYAPDYVINAGGALALPLLYQGVTESEVLARVAGIGNTLAQILAESARLNESPFHATRRRVQRILM